MDYDRGQISLLTISLLLVTFTAMPIRFSAQRSIAPISRFSRTTLCCLGILPLLLLGLTIGATPGQAQTRIVPQPQAAPQPTSPPAPAQLTQTLTQIDAAANQHDLQAVMGFYSPSFTNSDGLTVADMEAALKALWQRYPNLTYSTQINSWTQEGNAIVVETTTTITAAALSATPAPLPQSLHPATNAGATEATPAEAAPAPRSFALKATLTSRQRFEAQKIVQQDMLSERTEMTSGDHPPTIDLSLPPQVTTGQTYDFDALVKEPLGDRLLLGAALEEPISPTSYLNPTPINLEPLSAGGIFKVGQAPIKPENRWLSAVIIRDDGITTVTQRLQVSPPGGSQNP